MTIEATLKRGFDKLFDMSKQEVTIQVVSRAINSDTYEEEESATSYTADAIIGSDIEDAFLDLGVGYVDTGRLSAYFKPTQSYLSKGNYLVVESDTYLMMNPRLRKVHNTKIYYKVELSGVND